MIVKIQDELINLKYVRRVYTRRVSTTIKDEYLVVVEFGECPEPSMLGTVGFRYGTQDEAKQVLNQLRQEVLNGK